MKHYLQFADLGAADRHELQVELEAEGGVDPVPGAGGDHEGVAEHLERVGQEHAAGQARGDAAVGRERGRRSEGDQGEGEGAVHLRASDADQGIGDRRCGGCGRTLWRCILSRSDATCNHPDPRPPIGGAFPADVHAHRGRPIRSRAGRGSALSPG